MPIIVSRTHLARFARQIAGCLRGFAYLHYGLAVLLAFAGVTLILSETPVGKLPIPPHSASSPSPSPGP
ncbi:hypothetical protein [Actinacidiphila glaucinigra]|uniref:hypothetical protein n=1 Tax=Actinacidiphila glaucinigra TaxID=235986 RepID=UPI003AF36663